MVGRDAALADGVHRVIEIELADFERILADREGHFIDDALGADHALRAAEAAEGGVGDGVGVERHRFRVDGRIEIGVVAMEQRPVADRTRQVGGKAAAQRISEVDAENIALVIEADLVVDREIVPLAGGGHVLVAVEPDLHRALELLGRDSGNRRALVSLRFLAAEAAAHAAHFDRHRMARHAERMGDQVLCFARPLCRAIDDHLVVLAGDRQRDLALEIEMVLAAEPHAVLDAPGCRRDRRGRITALQDQRRGDLLVLDRIEVPDVDHSRQLVILDHGQARRAARLLASLGHYGEDRLAVELHLAFGEHRIVMHVARRNIVLARHVGMGQHIDDAGCRTHGRQVDALEHAMGDLGKTEANMQRASGLRHVVDIDGGAADMLVGGIVPLVGGDAADDLLGLEIGSGVLVHQAASLRDTWNGALVPVVST